MNWRRLWLWLVLLVAAVALLWLDRLERRTTARGHSAAPAAAAAARKPAAAIDLRQHDGAAIDFSSGRPVVKDSPADRAAVARAVKEMDEAAKDVTFPPTTTPAPEKPPAPKK